MIHGSRRRWAEMVVFGSHGASDLVAGVPRGLVVIRRTITIGDEAALRPEELRTMTTGLQKNRRASGAARIAARAAMRTMGLPACSVPRSVTGAPTWPEGLVGSLAHDERVAIAAVARVHDVVALGVDVEPANALPAEMVDLVVTPRESREIDRSGVTDPLIATRLFVVKEAVYKALHPSSGMFLEFHDIEVDLVARVARVRGGNVLDLWVSRDDHIIALAWVSASPPGERIAQS